MGIHYVNTSLLNGPIDATQPQALIYEPTANGQYKLVGVEFIILASALPPNAAPQLEGHLMLYIDGPSASRPKAPPNRYGLPAVLRTPRLGVAGQPPGRVRGLERPCDLRTRVERRETSAHIARLPCSVIQRLRKGDSHENEYQDSEKSSVGCSSVD